MSIEYTSLNYFSKKLMLLQKEKDMLPFKDTDVRKDFYSFIIATLDNYYKCISIFGLCDLIAKGKVLFTKDNETEAFHPHLIKLQEISTNPTALGNLRNLFYRNLITDSWSLFETCINAICHHVLGKQTQLELIHKNQKRKKIVRPGHISELGIKRKYNLLFNLVEKQVPSSSLEQDKEFLNFLGTLRNCMHNNYIYYGEYYQYSYNGIKYIFEDGKSFYNEAFRSPNSMDFFDLILRLIEVYSHLTKNIEFPFLTLS